MESRNDVHTKDTNVSGPHSALIKRGSRDRRGGGSDSSFRGGLFTFLGGKYFGGEGC